MAFVLCVVFLARPKPWVRFLEIAFAMGGILAHSIYLGYWQPPLVGQFGWLLLSSWVLTVIYLYGVVHYRQFSWGLFILPLVISLVVLGVFFPHPDQPKGSSAGGWFASTRILGLFHVGLLLSATVSICLGSLASAMYLFQARQVRVKLQPGKGLALFNLEKLESWIRGSIGVAFPLLTLGMVGGMLLIAGQAQQLQGWLDPRVISTGVLWLAFLALVFARYGFQVRGKQLAWVTLTTFFLLLICLVLPHSFPQEGGR